FTNIVSSLSMQAPELIIGKTLGFAATGIYSRANGIVSMFWTGGISGVLPVIHTEFARRNREGEDLIEIYRKGVSYITVIAWPAFLYMALFSESIIVFLFGDQWDAAAPVASVLAINLMVFALFSMNPNVLLALGKVSDHMKFSVVGDLIRISLIFVAASYSLVHIAYALVISRMIIGVMGSYYVSSHIGIGMWNIVEPSIKSLGIAIGSMILPYYIFSYQVVSENHLLILLGSGFLFSIGWVFLVYLLRHPFSNEIDEMFCRLKDRFRDG
ncbi:MAG: oligosaccharide flippase family protein, partial [Gammaproteobacteria bacterium]|nr:oligosaccharide flippase family protein [Gammaproteobacteria bacterium]